MWWRFGDPLVWIAVQSAPGWDQGSGPRTWFKLIYIGTVRELRWEFLWALTAQAICCLITVLLLLPVLRRLGWGYFAFTFVVIAVPIIGTKDFMGTGRYMLMAFPAFAAAGAILAEGARDRAWLRPAVLAVSAIWLFTVTYYLGWGYEVS